MTKKKNTTCRYWKLCYKKSLQTDVSVEKKFEMYASTLMLIAYYIKGIEEINQFQSHLFTLFGHYYEIEWIDSFFK